VTDRFIDAGSAKGRESITNKHNDLTYWRSQTSVLKEMSTKSRTVSDGEGKA
jgi:hypothetical protein